MRWNIFQPGSAFYLPLPIVTCALQLTCLAASRPASAAPAYQLTPTSLEGNQAFASVPSSFDPIHASDTALAQYGFPPRPNSLQVPGDYRSWQQAVAGIRRITPALLQTSILHGPNLARGSSLARKVHGGSDGPAPGMSSNWSGYVAPGAALAYGNQSLVNIYGDWGVPPAQLPFGTCTASSNGGAVNSSTFVGLDGNGSGDVLQAGTESDATCSAGVTGTFQDAWYEWYPYDEVRVTNLAVATGSVMYVQVWATSATIGNAYICNETTGLSVSVQFTAPPGFSLIGNSAEWIIERPAVDGALSNLTNYVQEFLTAARAVDAQGNDYFPGIGQPSGVPPAEQIEMLDNNGAVISVPLLMGHNGIWFNVQGSAL